MSKHPLSSSFKFAFKGLQYLWHERNFRLHLLSAALVVAAGLIFNVRPMEWIVLILCTGIVIVLEIVNTAIEKLTDLVSPGFNPLAGKVKDIAAAAVLVFSMVSVVIALMIFIPYFAN